MTFTDRSPLLRATGRERLRRLRRIALWWWALIFFAIGAAVARSHADDVGFPVHGAGLESALFGGIPSTWLQAGIYEMWPQGIAWAVFVVHVSWFFVPWSVPLFVMVARPERFGSVCRWWMALQLTSLAVFVTFPMQPPWLADPDVTRVLSVRLGEIQDSNPLAAMPSLHVALPLVLSLWLFNEGFRWPGRIILAYALVVAFEVVLSGEHYVVDVLGSVGACFLVLALSRVEWSRLPLSIARWFPDPTPSDEPLKPVLGAVNTAGREGGQALIEMALVLPLLLVFILALVDFGIAIDHRQVLQHAVRDGVRFGAVGNSADDVKAHVVDQAIDLGGGFTVADVDVCYVDENGNGNPGNAGDSIRVTANYTYNFSVGGGELLSAFGVSPPSIDMTPSAKLRLEQSVAGANACP